MDTRIVSTKVAVQYSQRLEHIIDSNAGAKERARFMDATETKTKKNICPTIPPITIFPKPFNSFVYTTTKFTVIKRAEAKTSIPKIKRSG